MNQVIPLERRILTNIRCLEKREKSSRGLKKNGGFKVKEKLPTG